MIRNAVIRSIRILSSKERYKKWTDVSRCLHDISRGLQGTGSSFDITSDPVLLGLEIDELNAEIESIFGSSLSNEIDDSIPSISQVSRKETTSSPPHNLLNEVRAIPVQQVTPSVSINSSQYQEELSKKLFQQLFPSDFSQGNTYTAFPSHTNVSPLLNSVANDSPRVKSSGNIKKCMLFSTSIVTMDNQQIPVIYQDSFLDSHGAIAVETLLDCYLPYQQEVQCIVIDIRSAAVTQSRLFYQVLSLLTQSTKVILLCQLAHSSMLQGLGVTEENLTLLCGIQDGSGLDLFLQQSINSIIAK